MQYLYSILASAINYMVFSILFSFSFHMIRPPSASAKADGAYLLVNRSNDYLT